MLHHLGAKLFRVFEPKEARIECQEGEESLLRLLGTRPNQIAQRSGEPAILQPFENRLQTGLVAQECQTDQRRGLGDGVDGPGVEALDMGDSRWMAQLSDGQGGLATNYEVGIGQQGDERVCQLGVLAPAQARHRRGTDPGIGILEEGQQERTCRRGAEFAQRACRARAHEGLIVLEERFQQAQGPLVALQAERPGYAGPGLRRAQPHEQIREGEHVVLLHGGQRPGDVVAVAVVGVLEGLGEGWNGSRVLDLAQGANRAPPHE